MDVELLSRELAVRDAAEDVGRKDRHGCARRERAVDVRQREPDGLGADPLDGHAAEGVGVWTDIRAVLEQLDRVDDVVGGDVLAVVPHRVRTDLERPHLALRLRAERRGEVRDDRAVAIEPREAAEHQARDVLVDVGRGDHRIEVLRHAGDAFHVRAAIRGDDARLARVHGDRHDADDDHQREERDDDELVARGHLADVGLARANQGDDHEHGDEHDREAEQRALESATAPVRGGLTTEGRRQPRPAGLQEDRCPDRDGNDDLRDLKEIHRSVQCMPGSPRDVRPERSLVTVEAIALEDGAY